MKIALITPIWQRPDLTKIVLEDYRRQSKKYGFEIIVAGSEGDKSRKLCNDLHYIEVLNTPLSAKNNSLVKKAKELAVDGLVMMGSDDLVSDSFWELIYSYTGQEKEYIGLKECYFYDTSTRESYHFKGYARSIGAGRYFSKEVLDKAGWLLWDDSNKNYSMDSNQEDYLKSKNIKQKIINPEDVYLLDVKHSLNITNKKSILPLCDKPKINIMSKIDKKTSKKVEVLDEESENKRKSLKKAVKGIKDNKDYTIIGTGKILRLGEEKTVKGKEARMFIEKGLAVLK